MPIRIVKHGQTYSKAIQGAVFTLRRESLQRRQELVDEYLQRPGQPPRMLLFVEARLQEALVGWTGVTDQGGREVPFDKALVGVLPDAVRSELNDALNQGPDPLASSSATTSPSCDATPNGAPSTEA